MLRYLSPTLWTNNIKASINFYTTVLEFTCAAYDEGWGWASLHKVNVQIMLASPNAHEPMSQPLHFTGALYLYTDEVDEWWLKLKDKCQVLYPIENFAYNMREFCILDNNGYRIQFGTEIAMEEE